jgi:hypothetical protein
MNAIKTIASALALVAGALTGVAHAVTITNVSVNAQANVYGSDPGGGGAGVAAVSELLPNLTARVVTFANVVGQVSCCSGGRTFNGPDGGPFAGGNTRINAFGGTSGIVAPGTMFLVGVFRDVDGPGLVAPAAIDFTSTTGNASFSPLVDQVFFIGDGLTGTGSGSTQSFLVPDAATRMELGFADAFGFKGNPGFYNDNVGGLRLDYSVTGVPEPSTYALLAVGLAGVGFAARRRRG